MAKKPNANVNAIQAVENLWKKIPQPLVKLLEKEGFDVEAEPPARRSKVSIERKLQKDGLLEQAKDWISSFSSAARLAIPSKSASTAREIAWKFVELKAEAEREQWLRDAHIEMDGQADPNADKLPLEINWVYRHPLIRAVEGSESPALIKSGKKYEQTNKCPSNGARARLNNARVSTKTLETFMAHVDKILTGHRKADDEAAKRVGLTELAEEESIADLEIQLLQEMEAKLEELGAQDVEVY